MEPMKEKVDGVFEGGGVKGIALVGAVAEVEKKYEFINLAGNSAGAIVASLLAAKYTAAQIREIINNFNFKSFMDERDGMIGGIPIMGQMYRLMKWKGLYKGNVFLTLMRKLLADQGIKYFGDLRREKEELDAIEDKEEREKYEYKLKIIATDITKKKMLVLPQDIKDYGQDPATLEVAQAVRMSMSYPFFFEAVPLADSLIVDGGVVSNFPVGLFDSKETPKWPTFGFKLVLSKDKNPAQLKQQIINGPMSEFIAIFQTAMEAHDAYYLDKSKYVRTIDIDSLGIGTTDFSLSDLEKEELYQSGVQAAKEFLVKWDFEEYKNYYRSNLQLPSRRDIVNNPMQSINIKR